ncbi:hypothetical protein TNCV_2346201 [Trichonephila clavipes]|nr:hypothetical protein TNCV_2346201 [Trichonephila clavipes]
MVKTPFSDHSKSFGTFGEFLSRVVLKEKRKSAAVVEFGYDLSFDSHDVTDTVVASFEWALYQRLLEGLLLGFFIVYEFFLTRVVVPEAWGARIIDTVDSAVAMPLAADVMK